jgi:hypothetical protein
VTIVTTGTPVTPVTPLARLATLALTLAAEVRTANAGNFSHVPMLEIEARQGKFLAVRGSA